MFSKVSLIAFLFLSLFSVAGVANAEEVMHDGRRYQTIVAETAPALKKETISLIKEYTLPAQVKREIRAHFDGRGDPKDAPPLTLTVTIDKFYFRAGAYFSSGPEGRDFLQAKVVLTGNESIAKTFIVSTTLEKGFSRKSRARRLAKELGRSIVDSL